MQANNGPQGHFVFTGQQMNNVNGMYPATPVQNTRPAAMRQPINHSNTQTQQGFPEGPYHFVVPEEFVNLNGNPYARLPMRNHRGAAMNVAPRNPQLAQHVPRSQPGPVNQQMMNGSGFNSEMAFGNNNNTMDAATQFPSPIGQQPGQFQRTQNAQIYQNTEEYQSGQNYQYGQNQQYAQSHQFAQNQRYGQSYHNSSNNQIFTINPARRQNSPHNNNNTPCINQPGVSTNYAPPSTSQSHQPNAGRMARAATAPRAVTAPQTAAAPRAATVPRAAIPSQASIPPQAGSHSHAGQPTTGSLGGGTAETQEPSLGARSVEEVEDRVQHLLLEKATTFKAHIKNKEECARFKQAVWKARRVGGNYVNKAGDYPKDEAGALKVIGRIFDAIVNVQGEQDPASETGDFANCLAVKIIKGLSSIDVELLAHKFMVSTITTPSFY